MAQNSDVNFRIRAFETVSQKLKKVTRTFGPLGQAIGKVNRKLRALNAQWGGTFAKMKKFGQGAKNIGRSMTIGLTAPIAIAGASIIRTSLSFQKSINKVGALTQTIIGGVVSPEFQQLEERAKLLGRTTEFSSTQAADAMGLLARAGFSTTEILDSTADVLALASSTGFELAFSADVMAKTIRAFGLEAKEAGRVTDVLALVSAKSNVDLETLSETFKDAAPIAKAYGLTLEQTAALTGLLGDVGIQGSKAGTTLKTMMLQLAAPGAKAKKILQALNITVSKGADGMVDVGTILSDLAPKLAKFPKQAQLEAVNELFGLRGIAGASALMSKAIADGKDPVGVLTSVLLSANGVAKDMQKTMLRGLPGAMARFESALEGAQLAIGNSGMIEWFSGILEGLTDMFSALAESNPVLLKWGTGIAIVVALVGPLLIGIGSLIAMLPFLAAGWTLVSAASFPITGSVLAIAAGVGVLIVALTWLASHWNEIWNGMKIVASDVFGWLVGKMNAMLALVKKIPFIGNSLANAFAPGGFVPGGAQKAAQSFGPEQSSTGAQSMVQGALSGAQQPMSSQATVDVNFNNAPKGTRVNSSSEGDLLLNLGFAGGLQ